MEAKKEYKGSELEFWLNGKWCGFAPSLKIRLKPKPDYTKEIEELQKKANNNGQKAVITFEEL